MRVAIAGATGFVGRALCEALVREHRVVGLTRGASNDRGDDVEWRTCDLYSLLQLERALEGCDVALYLVHSMLPSARLTQASFEDLDLLLADNFARAAATCGVKHIVYLGGLLPEEHQGLSPHLRSRSEVERALSAHGASVTALRAGLVVGAGGSSLHILVSLVRRLPAMLTPKWTSSPTQPIALRDVVRAVRHVLEAPERWIGAYDVGGPDVMSYREMMARTAQVLGKHRPMVAVPLFTPGLSKLWVSLITGAPLALVGPLIESLRHAMVVGDNPLQRWLLPAALGFEDALREAIATRSERPRVVARSDRRRARNESTARSVQRLPRPPGSSGRWVAEEYVRWLPRGPVPGMACETEETERGPVVRFRLRALRKPLLVLRLAPERTREDRALFYVEGGLLARTSPTPGRFEFRVTPDGNHVLAAVHDFRPALPWFVYALTQANVHALVMNRFGRHLARVRPTPKTTFRAEQASP
ncbi:MAG: NAD-dependent epimerase/dehydratase family protein [Sandaracinus sp.]|nr:NAD-dependent epimerase/dehydratase family protein [Sandaracinus sp.]MCB9633127.1 NAD-dependent epimerase/dehydratase family protein [Sandaracinus sp.]